VILISQVWISGTRLFSWAPSVALVAIMITPFISCANHDKPLIELHMNVTDTMRKAGLVGLAQDMKNPNDESFVFSASHLILKLQHSHSAQIVHIDVRLKLCERMFLSSAADRRFLHLLLKRS